MKRTLRNLARSGPVILGILAASLLLLLAQALGSLAYLAITDSDYWWPLRAGSALLLALSAAGCARLAYEIIKDAAA
jgi:hypothetical protein